MHASEILDLRALVEDAVRQALPSCGIPIGEPFDPDDAFDTLDTTEQLVAFMGFTGPVLRGTLALVAPLDIMRGSYPLLLKDRACSVFDVFDWTGEVANHLLAKAKSNLASRGVTIEASTPRVMLAQQPRVTRSVQGTICSTCFASGYSWIKVWFDAIAPDDQPVFGSSLAEHVVLSAGDAVIF